LSLDCSGCSELVVSWGLSDIGLEQVVAVSLDGDMGLIKASITILCMAANCEEMCRHRAWSAQYRIWGMEYARV